MKTYEIVEHPEPVFTDLYSLRLLSPENEVIAETSYLPGAEIDSLLVALGICPACETEGCECFRG